MPARSGGVWPDGERKKALLKKHLSRDDMSLFLFQWLEHLEARIRRLEVQAITDSVIVKPKPPGGNKA